MSHDAAVALVAAALVWAAAAAAEEPAASQPTTAAAPHKNLDRGELIRIGVEKLLEMQEPDGAWPYEGVYRVRGEIPVGYRIGGTAIVCEALLFGAPAGDARVERALERGVAFILPALDHALMKPSTENKYDVRVWGHSYALEYFCHLRAAKRAGQHAEAVEAWIPKLIAALATEQLDTGGWNYANRDAAASFVTAPVMQALLLARSQGEKVPEDVLTRGARALRGMRLRSGNFLYSGSAARAKDQDGARQIPGAIARMPVCEATLKLLGGAEQDEPIRKALGAFHEHWEWLEKRRKQQGTHVPPYSIAPYYFYYGHRYAAQAIELLPADERARAREQMLETILRTRDDDGTWNDRVFARSRNFGTAMCVLALLQEKTPVPPAVPPDLARKIQASESDTQKGSDKAADGG